MGNSIYENIHGSHTSGYVLCAVQNIRAASQTSLQLCPCVGFDEMMMETLLHFSVDFLVLFYEWIKDMKFSSAHE